MTAQEMVIATHTHTSEITHAHNQTEVEVVSEHKLIEIKVSAAFLWRGGGEEALCVNTFYGIL